jgi:Fe2+ transport system protein FeoA
MMTLEQVVPGVSVVIEKVGGARAFRRRLMELGIIPGTRVEVLRIAPFGDPMELCARGCNLSIRVAEAREVQVTALAEKRAGAPARARSSDRSGDGAGAVAFRADATPSGAKSVT